MNKSINIANKVINSVKKGNIFETAKSKFIVTYVNKPADKITITELVAVPKMKATKTFTNPKTGETITKTDNTPVLSDSKRKMKLSVFAELVDKKVFEPSKFAYTEKHFGVGHGINRYMVKETTRFF